MHTILLTGANGFVGHYLTEQLLSKNFNVIATGKGESRLPFTQSNFLYESLDFTNEKEVASVLQRHRPDVVVHGGAISKPDVCEQNKELAHRINVEATRYLLNQSALLKSFFVYISTDFVFSGDKEGYYQEEDTTGPVNYYGQTKVEAENAVKNYPYGWSIVRTILVYGHPKSGRDNILTNVANALRKQESLNIFSDQTRTPTYVEDLVAGIVRIIEKRAEGIFHLSGEDVVTPYEMACAVANYLQLDAQLIKKVTAETFQQPALRPPKTCFDLSKAKAILGYTATSFREGLQKTFTD